MADEGNPSKNITRCTTAAPYYVSHALLTFDTGVDTVRDHVCGLCRGTKNRLQSGNAANSNREV